MKRFIGMLFGALMVMVGVFSSCDKNEDLNQVPQTETKETRASALRSASALSYGMHIVGSLPYADPLHGRPNETTYKFYVANPPSDLQGVVIVFATPAGGKATRVMKKNLAGNFFHEQTLSQSGRYEVKYLLRYRTPKAEKTVVPSSGFIDNTLVNFDGETKKLVWPFGADGSSNDNRSGWRITCGHNEGHHTDKYNDVYALDWQNARVRRGNEIRSPLDGKVVRKLFDSRGGNLITISQTIGTKTYVFQAGHMRDLPSLAVGSYVQAGKTVLGYVGETGNTTGPHTHMSLKQNTIRGASTKFDFSAQ